MDVLSYFTEQLSSAVIWTPTRGAVKCHFTVYSVFILLRNDFCCNWYQSSKLLSSNQNVVRQTLLHIELFRNSNDKNTKNIAVFFHVERFLTSLLKVVMCFTLILYQLSSIFGNKRSRSMLKGMVLTQRCKHKLYHKHWVKYQKEQKILIRGFPRSLARSLARSFVRLYVRSFVCSFVRQDQSEFTRYFLTNQEQTQNSCDLAHGLFPRFAIVACVYFSPDLVVCYLLPLCLTHM